MSPELFQSIAAEIHEEIVGFRCHLHQNPELSFEEVQTSAYIKSILDRWQIPYTDGLAGGTGIVAEIGNGTPVIALRADIDALPIQETNEIAYKSQINGRMHACGHDVHTSSLLGCLYILNRLKGDLPCRYRFLFQPGEEKLPGGASLMIRDGAIDNPTVSSIFGQHVHPSLPVGQVGVKGEHFMASCDEIFMTVRGRGGHGAMPQDIIDPVLISAEIITGLQSVISRNCHPNIPSVLSIGKIYSEGGATNVIPDEVKMEGTFRTFDEEWRYQAHQLIIDRATHIALAHGAEVDIDILKGYPSLYNDPDLTQRTIVAMKEYLGAQNVIILPSRMTAEDFSYYSQKVPACFYRLGTAATDGTLSSPVHTSTFDVHHDALLHGPGLMAWLAYQEGLYQN